MKPNAMLTKKQSCGSMSLSFGSNSSDRPLVPIGTRAALVWYYVVPTVKRDDDG